MLHPSAALLALEASPAASWMVPLLGQSWCNCRLWPSLAACLPHVVADLAELSLTWLRHSKVVLLAVKCVKQGVQACSDIPATLQHTAVFSKSVVHLCYTSDATGTAAQACISPLICWQAGTLPANQLQTAGMHSCLPQQYAEHSSEGQAQQQYPCSQTDNARLSPQRLA